MSGASDDDVKFDAAKPANDKDANNWNLSKIDPEQRERVAQILAEHYDYLRTEMIALGDDFSHPVVFVQGIIRWEEVPLLRQLLDCRALDLCAPMDAALRRQVSKGIGYSMSGYSDLNCCQSGENLESIEE